MKSNLRIISSLFLVLLVMGTVFAACEVDVENFLIELRNENEVDYSEWEEIAGRSEDVDIRISFDVTDYTSSCSSNLTVNAKIYRFNENSDSWSLLTTKTQTKTLDTDYYIINFNDAFNTGSNDNYSQYKIEGRVLIGSNEVEFDEGFVEVENNSCDGIIITTHTINARGGDTTNTTFSIENKTNSDFRITTADLTSTSSLISSGRVNSPSYVYSKQISDLGIELVTRNVTNPTNTTVSLSIAGYLGNTFCSTSTIGKKNFTVRVEHNPLEQNWVSSNTDCDLIEINSFKQEYLEGTEQNIILDLKNNSSKRFEILGVETKSTEMILTNYFNERFVSAGGIENIILKSKLPQVSKDTTVYGTIRVRGAFSDGKTCSFTQIKPKTIEVNVINSIQESSITNCAGFFITAPDSITIQNSGLVGYTINNQTNKPVTILVESEFGVEVTPTTIIIPRNDSFTGQINILTSKEYAQIKLVPKIEGCTLPQKIISINNTARGTLTQSQLTLTTQRDYNKKIITLSVEVTNPTNKTFNGVMRIETPQGWPNIEKNVVINPGTNNLIEKLGASGETSEGEIRVSINSDGSNITSTTPTENRLGVSSLSATGLFLLGSNLGSIGVILLIILLVVLIIGVIESPNNQQRQSKEEWRGQ